MKRQIALALLLVVATSLPGCSKPPQVSAGNRRLVDALRTATSTKMVEWVDQCEEQLELNRQQGTTTDAEFEEFRRIIALARAGKWKEAEAATASLGKAQRPTAEDLARLKR
jgi:hypothetical protein